MEQDKMPYLPDADRHQFLVSEEIRTRRGYRRESDALMDRSYKDKVQIPVLPPGTIVASGDEKEVLLALYAQVCSGWRTLTDVRFKLLGLLPLVSGAVLITLLSTENNTYPLEGRWQLAVGLFGLAVTLGLAIYEKRNSVLYNDLIGRGRQIEQELGVHTGHFRGRPKGNALLNHSLGLNLVYGATCFAWLLVLFSGYTRL